MRTRALWRFDELTTEQRPVDAMGNVNDLVAPVEPPPSWTIDAQSGIAVPQNAAEASALLASAGIVGVPTLALYLFGAAPSGNIVDASGNGRDLVVSGTVARQQTVAGWTTKSMRTSNGVAGRAIYSPLPDVNSNSYTLILWALQTSFTGASAERSIMRIGAVFGDDACIEIQNTTTNKLRVGEGDNTRSTGAADPSGVARPFVLRIDDAGNQVDGFTDQEKVVGGVQSCNGQELCFGGNNVATWFPPTCDFIWAWLLGGALTDPQLGALLRECGATIPWTP